MMHYDLVTCQRGRWGGQQTAISGSDLRRRPLTTNIFTLCLAWPAGAWAADVGDQSPKVLHKLLVLRTMTFHLWLFHSLLDGLAEATFSCEDTPPTPVSCWLQTSAGVRGPLTMWPLTMWPCDHWPCDHLTMWQCPQTQQLPLQSTTPGSVIVVRCVEVRWHWGHYWWHFQWHCDIYNITVILSSIRPWPQCATSALGVNS